MKKVFLGIRWFFALGFFVGGMTFLVAAPLATFFAVAAAFVISPLSRPLLFSRLPFRVSWWKKAGLALGLIFLYGTTAPTPPPSTTSTPSPTPVIAAPLPVLGEAIEATTSATASASASESATPVDRYLVTAVVDGDTIKISREGKTETVRVVGIDTPETVDPRRPVECFGIEASKQMKNLVLNQTVSLETDPTQSDRDKYGRLLRFVFQENGIDVGLQLIRDGYAQEALYSQKPHKYHEQYVAAQAAAQATQKGLWSPTICPVPTPSPTPTPKSTPTSVPATKPSTKPTSQPAVPTSTSNPGSGGTTTVKTTSTPTAPAPATNGSWSCNCSKTCPNMSSCAEAQYQLNTCGCSARDSDHDGVACDADCQ